ncbi:MAG TPA: hypothetical protein VGE07_00555 [Herpetosiphonaceae bacterium]
MIIVYLALGGLAAVGIWFILFGPEAQLNQRQASERAALLAQLPDLAGLAGWGDDKLQSARWRADRLVDSQAFWSYVRTYEDGDQVERQIYAYQAALAEEWTRRFKPLNPSWAPLRARVPVGDVLN